MSIKNECSSLQTLPVEILHRIYDCLDIQTILFYLHNTCRRLKAVVKSYDRCILDIKKLSKFDLRRLSRRSNLENIVSLILSGDDHYRFVSSFGVKQFTQIRVLKLYGIQESNLRDILKCVNIHSITSFSLFTKPNGNRYESAIATLISSMLVRSNLRKLELNIHSDRIEKIIWYNTDTIEYLRIGTCIDFGQICKIVSGLSHLRTLVLNSFSIIYSDNNLLAYSLPKPFLSLISLTVTNLKANMNDIEKLLSLTPSLISLKLIGMGQFLDGYRWQNFIQNNLPLLSKFDFVFNQIIDKDKRIPDLEKIIVPFKTIFWVENKKWFVTCEYNIEKPEKLRLYSVPMCLSSCNDEFETIKISLSTLPDKFENNASIPDNSQTMMIDFKEFMSTKYTYKKDTVDHQLFRKVEKLELKFDSTRPENWLLFVSTITDLTTIQRIIITGQVIYEANADMIVDITNLLRETCNISTLDICTNFHTGKSGLTAMNICSMTPNHVRHLTTSIKDISEAMTVLLNLQDLASAHFFFDHFPIWDELIAWLKEQRKDSTYYSNRSSIFVSLQQSSPQYKENDTGTKRIKLTHDHNNA